eukprot:TRINITY_DN2710_c2_g1_i2.p1 TRINITY_DN2710_c2_g1~~TRINITY_DN2710_c2_g1_i2.p1  ORF type:complete len:421 (+),score=182.94 TRINITY_DN2710_c2_g1_i2:73-1335(+)
MKKTSFKKKNIKGVSFANTNEEVSQIDITETKLQTQLKTENEIIKHLPGVKISPHNSLPTISTGITDLDEIFGSGVPLSSLNVIEEDDNTRFWETFVKCFISEGLGLNQRIIVIGATGSRDFIHTSFINKLPRFSQSNNDIVSNEESEENQSDITRLKIAWRYEKNEIKDSIKHSSTVDLNKKVDETVVLKAIEDKKLTILDISENENDLQFETILNQIIDHLNNKTSVLRIVLLSFGTLFWSNSNVKIEANIYGANLLQFIHKLKRLLILNSNNSCALISIPIYLQEIRFNSFKQRLIHLADSAFSINSFKDSNQQQSFPDMIGLFRIIKLPRVNSLIWPIIPQSLIYGFSLKRHRITLQLLHLQPEHARWGSNSNSDQQNNENDKSNNNNKEINNNNSSISKLICQPGPPKSNSDFDF